MDSGDSDPVARDAFDRLASGYDERGESKPANAHHERPATLSLLPDVSGEIVLDAGCGAGHLAAELVEGGASVVGVDVSPAMLSAASERVPAGAFVQAALGSGLPLSADSVDGIASSLAFHYVRDWGPLFDELRRVVVPGGWVVFSVQHPHADFVEYDDVENYHDTERVSATWEGFGEPVEVPAYRRPLAAMVNPPLEAGFSLTELVEAEPTLKYRELAPKRYEYESTNPTFLCLRFDAPA
ncbi:MAG: methyltransferase domain-containing protein [Halolamina sp.]|uniref:class I SAM-dependent methyltransferase n=1 Tax=Halolamina sp. TaxID=1940283 RepID=UPI002FC2D960